PRGEADALRLLGVALAPRRARDARRLERAVRRFRHAPAREQRRHRRGDAGIELRRRRSGRAPGDEGARARGGGARRRAAFAGGVVGSLPAWSTLLDVAPGVDWAGWVGK